MLIQIEGDDLLRASGDKAGPAARIIRSAAYFLLASIGDIPEETDGIVPTGTSVSPPAPPVAPAATAPAANTAVASAAASSTTMTPPAPTASEPAFNAPPPPPPPPTPEAGDESEGNNTGNVPPPPPGASTAAASSSSSVNSAAGAATSTGVVSVEVDSAGMPWDERIHQKGKSKKKDNTWKLKKGIDPALVQTVTAELAARRAASPAPTAGSLPLTGNSASNVAAPGPATGSTSVPMPPVPPAPAVAGVPAPNSVAGTVPVPPVAAVGSVGTGDATPYRKLIDKITELTKANKITPAKVSEICQANGSPSLMKLKEFEHLIPAVDRDIDAAALGLL